MSNVYQKLQAARILLQGKQLKKSGKNKFAGYEYFELQDFLPTVQEIFANTGLCAVFRCDAENATLTIYATDTPESCVVFTAPMAAAELKGCHPVQNLGASISYLRRYLYVNAMEIVEHDALDATTGSDAGKPAPKPVAKVEPKPATTADGTKISTEKPKTTKSWEIKVSIEPDANEAMWFDMVWQAATTVLGFVEAEADVMSIFKANKTLLDEAKDRDPEWFKKLMEEFTKTKNKFKEQA